MKANAERLIGLHALYSDRVRELKRLGSMESENCERFFRPGQERLTRPESCIGEAIQQTKDSSDEYGQEDDFEDVWSDMVDSGDVCAVCIKVREYKKEKIKAIRHLAAVRAAITRVGRKSETYMREQGEMV